MAEQVDALVSKTSSFLECRFDPGSGYTSPGGGCLRGDTLYIEPDAWGMVSGDGNADGLINNADKPDVWAVQAGWPAT